MKKIFLVATIAIMGATTANAGLLETLGLKKSEPTTLADACDTAEIKKVCPEIVLGTKTVQECLAENVSNLSKKCADFVKKSIVEKKDAAIAQVNTIKEEAATAKAAQAEQRAAEKQAAAEKKEAAKKAVAEKKEEIKKSAAEKKAAAKAVGNEIADAVKETGEAARDTGSAIKNMF